MIAETTDLPTKFAKIVVTDDQGRYVIPDLPKANYKVWVRGYGLVDSPKVTATPGKIAQPDGGRGAERDGRGAVLSADLLVLDAEDPGEERVSRHGPGQRHAEHEEPGRVAERHQDHRLHVVPRARHHGHAHDPEGARRVHELGRGVGAAHPVRTGHDADGQRRSNRLGTAARAQAVRPTGPTAIAAGELPFDKPARPQGIERNVVLTLWDWSTPTAYMHDLIATDRRNPTVNANGKLYGAPEESTDYVPVLDPKTHTASADQASGARSEDAVLEGRPDGALALLGRGADLGQPDQHPQPDDGREGPGLVHRARAPAGQSGLLQGRARTIRRRRCSRSNEPNRHLSMYDPATGKFTLIRTCFPTHHLIFAEDANNTLWTSSGVRGPGVVGWLNRKMFEETGDEVKSQGWTPFILDTNGNGKRDEYVEPDQPVDPTKDKRVAASLYSVARQPDRRFDLGDRSWDIPATSSASRRDRIRRTPRLTEIYEPPFPGYGPRGGDIDRNGVFWASLASGHLGELRPQQVQGPLNGPTATGKHCPEGWTLYPFPGPQFKDVQDDGSAEASYYTWVDQFDTFGLGKNVPIATGNISDALLGAGRRQVRHPARALSDGLLRQVGGRPHRRSQCRLEGQRRCGRPTPPARCSTSKAARRTGPRSCSSSFGPIRSPAKRRSRLEQQSRPALSAQRRAVSVGNGANAMQLCLTHDPEHV